MTLFNKSILAIFITVVTTFPNVNAQQKDIVEKPLRPRQQKIISIAATAANGDLAKLEGEINAGLDNGLTINEVKEVLVHLYAYCGFPRSIRGLQTLMAVLDERKANGISDQWGAEASPVKDDRSKYDRGREILGKLTGTSQDGPRTGYAAFAPEIEIFLKEHLFADIFERDVLSYAVRELVTVSVLSSIGGVEPMLRSHLNICLNVGLTPGQLQQFVSLIRLTVGDQEGNSAQGVLNDIFKNIKYNDVARSHSKLQINAAKVQEADPVFSKGEKITNNKFTGTAWLQMLVSKDSTFNTSIGNVTFEPGARSNWHMHPSGQILMITDGRLGYYQEKGKPIQLLHKGDVVKCLPNVIHWHGASPDQSLTHIALSPNLDKGSVVWLGKVTDEEYNSFIKKK